MEGTQHSITKTLKRFRSFRYSLILEGIAAGAAAGLVVVAFRLLLEGAAVYWTGYWRTAGRMYGLSLSGF